MEKSMSFVFHAQIITDVIFMKNQYTIACINLGIHFSFALTKKPLLVRIRSPHLRPSDDNEAMLKSLMVQTWSNPVMSPVHLSPIQWWNTQSVQYQTHSQVRHKLHQCSHKVNVSGR